MRKKVKSILFVVSIVYSLVIVILMGITTKNLVGTVELHDTDDNKEMLLSYKEELLKLEQNDCTKVISQMIKHYEETSYDGEIILREMYEYGLENGIISYYQLAKDKCNISLDDEKKYNFKAKFLTVSIQGDELFEKYYFQYELGIKDRPIRLIAEPFLLNVEYKINRDMELEIIKSLIELSSKEGVINE